MHFHYKQKRKKRELLWLKNFLNISFNIFVKISKIYDTRPRPFFTIRPLLVKSFTILSITPLTNFPELGDENSLAISIYSFKDTLVGIDGK